MRNKLWEILRPVVVFATSSLTTLSVFGLLLAGFWLVVPDDGAVYQFASSLVVSAIALTSGGWLTGKLVQGKGWRAGALFGLIFGLCSFSYLTGDWRTFIATPLATLFGGLGGWLAE
jgi:hypothetical protein